MPMLVMLELRDGAYVPGRYLRASDLDGALDQAHQAEWKTLGFDAADGSMVVPNGAIGFRWGDAGKWNLEATRRPRRRRSVAGADAGRPARRCRSGRVSLFRRQGAGGIPSHRA